MTLQELHMEIHTLLRSNPDLALLPVQVGIDRTVSRDILEVLVTSGEEWNSEHAKLVVLVDE